MCVNENDGYTCSDIVMVAGVMTDLSPYQKIFFQPLTVVFYRMTSIYYSESAFSDSVHVHDYALGILFIEMWSLYKGMILGHVQMTLYIERWFGIFTVHS